MLSETIAQHNEYAFFDRPVLSLENEHIRLDALAEAGPRIVRLVDKRSGQNLLAETPETHWPTQAGEYYLLGGHRLWLAPEFTGRSHEPDGSGLTWTRDANRLTLHGRVESTGICKTLEIELDSLESRLTITHRTVNIGSAAVEVAPWAITQVRPGGFAFMPLRTVGLVSHQLFPNCVLTFWPYTNPSDPRFQLTRNLICVQGSPQGVPFKVGTLNSEGWLAYYLDRTLLVKRFPVWPGENYPDLGCNAEIYANDTCVELETLAPLCSYQPGDQSELVETWEVHTDVEEVHTSEDLERLVEKYIK